MQHAKVPPSVSPQLDALRGWSAIAVLLAHANQIVVAPTWHGLYTLSGLVAQAAVMMFFALSGFLICKSITRNGASGFDVRAYAADRINRIAPPLAFSLVLVAVLWAVVPVLFPSGSREFALHLPFDSRQGFDVQPAAFFGSALFLNGFFTGHVSANSPLWSLAFEVWYYVAAGIVASLRGPGIVLAGALMLGMGWINHDFLLLSVVWFAGAGVALANNAGLRLSRITRPAGLVCLVAASLLGFTFLRDNSQAQSAEQIVTRAIPYFDVYAGLFFAALLYEVVNGGLRLPTFGRESAGYSYTLYIIHFPLLLVAYGIAQPRIRGVWASVAVGACAALACWALARWLARWLESLRPVRAQMSRTGLSSPKGTSPASPSVYRR